MGLLGLLGGLHAPSRRIVGVEVARNGGALFGLWHFQWSRHIQCELIARWQLSEKTNQMIQAATSSPFAHLTHNENLIKLSVWRPLPLHHPQLQPFLRLLRHYCCCPLQAG